MSWKNRIVEWSGRSVQAGRLMRALRPGLRVVLYHHVGEDLDLTRHLGCTTATETFERHARWMAKNYDVIGLDDLLSEAPLPRRPLLITFDDAYRSVLDTAGPILSSLGLPSLLFLVTEPVFEGRLVLDNLVSYARCHHPEVLAGLVPADAPDPVRSVLIDLIPNGGLEAREQVRNLLMETCGDAALAAAREADLYLRPEDLEALAGHGMTLGRHTTSHMPMGCVEDPRPEVVDGWERYGLDPASTAFSYPFGSFRDARSTVDRLKDLGIGPVFLVEGCSNPERRGIYYRVSPRQASTARLELDMEVLARIRRLRKRAAIDALEPTS